MKNIEISHTLLKGVEGYLPFGQKLNYILSFCYKGSLRLWVGIYDPFIGLTENSKKKENEEAEIHYMEMILGDTAAAMEENFDKLFLKEYHWHWIGLCIFFIKESEIITCEINHILLTF